MNEAEVSLLYAIVNNLATGRQQGTFSRKEYNFAVRNQ